MNKKLLLIFILSAITGSVLLIVLMLSEYMKGPELTLHNVTVELNEEVNAWTFVTECSEKNATVRYVETPDFTVPGGRIVEIEAVDSKGKSTVKKAALIVNIIKHNLKIDATGEELKVSDILVAGIDGTQASFVNKAITLNHVGTFEIRLLYQNVEYSESITVIDAQAPMVTLKDEVIAYQKHEFDPATAVESYSDATDVSFAVKGILNTEEVGEYPVIISATDEGDNVTEFTTMVKVIADTEFPVIEGAMNRNYFLGETVSYLDGVTARDAVDGGVEVYVDNGQVNADKEGSYEVTYSASDISGNQAAVTVTFTFSKMTATEEILYAKADEVLASITTDTMSLSQKAYEIYNYAYSNIAYTGTSDKSNWENEAYRGMMELNGDCFTYMSVCKVLLHRLGVETMEIQRVGGAAEHYWLMVNLGTGWYHFDATRRKEYFDGFMATDAELSEYGNRVGGNYYTYDTANYPATPLEDFQITD